VAGLVFGADFFLEFEKSLLHLGIFEVLQECENLEFCKCVKFLDFYKVRKFRVLQKCKFLDFCKSANFWVFAKVRNSGILK
jgi:hypothetical protein